MTSSNPTEWQASPSSDPPPFFPLPPPPVYSGSAFDPISNQNAQPQACSSTSNPSNKRKKASSTSPDVPDVKPKQQRSTAKVHICSICNSSFSRMFNLNQHVLIHTNHREFQCLEGSCNKLFLRSTDLTRHCKHVHGVDTKKDKRYSLQKKRLSEKNKREREERKGSAAATSPTSTCIPNQNYPPPLSPSFSSASSENTNSTLASSYSTNSAPQSENNPDPAYAARLNFPAQSTSRQPDPGSSEPQYSDDESMELDIIGDGKERSKAVSDSGRNAEASSLSLPPIQPALPATSRSAPPRSIVLPPINPAQSQHIPTSQGSSPLFPPILNRTSSSSSSLPSLPSRSFPSPSTNMKNTGPLTPTLPSIRSQLPFSFNGPHSIQSSQQTSSNSHHHSFEARRLHHSFEARRLPSIRTSST